MLPRLTCSPVASSSPAAWSAQGRAQAARTRPAPAAGGLSRPSCCACDAGLRRKRAWSARAWHSRACSNKAVRSSGSSHVNAAARYARAPAPGAGPCPGRAAGSCPPFRPRRRAHPYAPAVQRFRVRVPHPRRGNRPRPVWPAGPGRRGSRRRCRRAPASGRRVRTAPRPWPTRCRDALPASSPARQHRPPEAARIGIDQESQRGSPKSPAARPRSACCTTRDCPSQLRPQERENGSIMSPTGWASATCSPHASPETMSPSPNQIRNRTNAPRPPSRFLPPDARSSKTPRPGIAAPSPPDVRSSSRPRTPRNPWRGFLAVYEHSQVLISASGSFTICDRGRRRQVEQASPTALHANRSDMFNVAVDRRREHDPKRLRRMAGRCAPAPPAQTGTAARVVTSMSTRPREATPSLNA